MEKITYYKIPATGGGLRLKEGTVGDMLLSMPYLLNAHIPLKRRIKGLGVIPPLKIINEILATGIDSEGRPGGCKWEPFQINEEDFRELVAELSAEDPNYFRLVEPPASVRTRSDWEAWRNEYIKNAASRELMKKGSVKEKKVSYFRPALNSGMLCGLILGIAEVLIVDRSNPQALVLYPLIAFVIGFVGGFLLYYLYERNK